MTETGWDAIFISHANPEGNAFTMWFGARLTAAGSAIKWRRHAQIARRAGLATSTARLLVQQSGQGLACWRRGKRQKARRTQSDSDSLQCRTKDRRSRRRVEGVSVTTYSTQKLVLVALGQRDVVERQPS